MSIARDTKPCNQSVSARPKFHAGTGLMLYEQQTPRQSRQACIVLGLKAKRTRAYRPQTNGKAERFI